MVALGPAGAGSLPSSGFTSAIRRIEPAVPKFSRVSGAVTGSASLRCSFLRPSSWMASTGCWPRPPETMMAVSASATNLPAGTSTPHALKSRLRSLALVAPAPPMGLLPSGSLSQLGSTKKTALPPRITCWSMAYAVGSARSLGWITSSRSMSAGISLASFWMARVSKTWRSSVTTRHALVCRGWRVIGSIEKPPSIGMPESSPTTRRLGLAREWMSLLTLYSSMRSSRGSKKGMISLPSAALDPTSPK